MGKNKQPLIKRVVVSIYEQLYLSASNREKTNKKNNTQ